MSDIFGNAGNGRATIGGRFYAKPAANCPSNTIFMPAYSTSPLFGINEVPVKSGELGAFATEGTFVFDAPESFTSSVGQAIYYAPTSATAGALSASSSAGAVRIGYEVTPPGRTGKLCVYIAPGDALVASAPESSGGSGASGG